MPDPSKTPQDLPFETTLGALPLPPAVDTPTGMPDAQVFANPLSATLPGPAPLSLPTGEARYVRVRLHATGGIGQVWLVHDEALGRDIALKELRPDRAHDSELEARFLNEARITGQLEHPAIVPIYELARRPGDDKPFYTMRFIKGRTLSTAVEDYHQRRRAGTDSPVELQKLLGAFVSVCNALAYAHARGIVHRDLKGSNVVLGDYGEVMVLDWGLAKAGYSPPLSEHEKAPPEPRLPPVAVDASPLATAPGAVIGTPAYMAPEQALGAVASIDARTDIYGLGAMLFEILTGRPPHVGSTALEVLERVVSHPAPHARIVLSAVPAALDAVCARALAREPGKRYPTADALAEDVRRWLAGEPVSAWREPAQVRLQRWVGRHRTLVASVAVAIVVAAAILAGATVYLTDANERERQARQLAETKEKEAKEKGEQARKSDTQSRKSLQQALAAIDRLLMRVSEDRERLAYEPHMEQVRRKLLEDAEEFYQHLLADLPDDPDIRLKTGQALTRLGGLRSDLGDFEQGKEALVKSLAMLQRLSAEFPDNLAYREALVRSHLAFGNAHRDHYDWRAAEKHYLEARALLTGWLTDRPGNARARVLLGTCYSEMGDMLTTTFGYDKSAGFAREAVTWWRGLVEQFPTKVEYRAGLADSLHQLGLVESRQIRLAAAEECLKEALLLRRQLIARDEPETPLFRLQLARTLTELGQVLQTARRLGEAAQLYQEALDIRAKTVADYPSYVNCQADLAWSWLNLSDVAYLQNKLTEGEQNWQRAYDILANLVRKYPGQASLQRNLAWCHSRRGYSLRERKLFQAAVAALHEAVKLDEALADKCPAEPSYRQELAAGYLDLGVAYRDARQFDQAADWLSKALPLLQQLVDDYPQEPSIRSNLGRCLFSLALIARVRSRPGRAEARLRRAMAVHDRLVQEYPGFDLYEVALAMNQAALCQALVDQNRGWEEILVLSARAKALVHKQLAAGHPDWLQKALVQAVLAEAVALASLDHGCEALRELDRALRWTTEVEERIMIATVREACRWRVCTFARRLARAGLHTQAMTKVSGLLVNARLDDDLLWELACVYSQAAGTVGKDARLTAEQRQQLRQHYVKGALDMLERLRQRGWFDVDMNLQLLREEPDLQPLRTLPEYQQWMKRLATNA
jgi:tetratricopeptide (TPR) repeat protein